MVKNNKLIKDNDKIKEVKLKKQKEIEKNIIDFSSKNNVRVLVFSTNFIKFKLTLNY